ncbi:MAG: hypothetical protein ACW99A_12610 [Candidatus Kariarchaeaceae archaeon]|jgi:hypothetical protein
MSESFTEMCKQCHKNPVKINAGIFVKRVIYCSEYCKARAMIIYEIFWLIISILTLILIWTISNNFFRFLFALPVVVNLYLVIKNYLTLQSHDPPENSN